VSKQAHRIETVRLKISEWPKFYGWTLLGLKFWISPWNILFCTTLK
jgi:hypothetical protein